MEVNGAPRWVLVTGASSGIGRACALYLDQIGFNVLGTVRTEADGDSLRAEGSDKLTTLIMDVTDDDTIKAAAEKVTGIVGDSGLYGLLNNAGTGFIAPMEFVPIHEMRSLFDLNVFGLLAVTQAFLPLVRQAKGRIVNVSSTASLFSMAYHGPYTASKCAVNAISNAMRLELKEHGVFVATAIPGLVRTDIFRAGRRITWRVVQDYPEEVKELYGQQMRKAMKFLGSGEKTGISPEQSAKEISRAFTDKHPRIRYYVGPDARLYHIANWFLIGFMRDWFVVRHARMS